MKQTIALLLMVCSSAAFTADKVTLETHYQLQVDGLVCPFCAYNIEKNLGKLEGVKSVKANLKEGLVSVLVVDGNILPEDVLRQTITDAGFTLKSIKIHESKNR